MKKKGLIVATIVMVLVLAVSLTTATYAWFTSDAKAEVEGVVITTQAATGVQIAVYQDTNFYNGQMTYSNSKWSSETEGFGPVLDFSNVSIGKMVNAVTNNTTSGDFVYTQLTNVTSGQPLPENTYTIATDGKPTKATGNAEADKVYYKQDPCTSGTFYRPTGYDDNTQPYGYYLAPANSSDNFENPKYTTYYDIPLAMQSADVTQAILCSIKINPGENTGNRWPGMAAATRVRITVDDQTITFEPYGGYKYSGTMTDQSSSADVKYKDKDTTGVLNFVVAYNNGAAITSADIYKIKVEIWVEGTDPECNTNLMGDTNFTVEFAFDVYDNEITNTDIETNKYVTKGGVQYEINTVSTGKDA